jgi:hypothetical protein
MRLALAHRDGEERPHGKQHNEWLVVVHGVEDQRAEHRNGDRESDHDITA